MFTFVALFEKMFWQVRIYLKFYTNESTCINKKT